jgi:hypothetical protein
MNLNLNPRKIYLKLTKINMLILIKLNAIKIKRKMVVMNRWTNLKKNGSIKNKIEMVYKRFKITKLQ